ncbi:MAG: hypothetical protein F4Y57_09645 [Acidobacteria bacterium]|nr:hypothetical protein [Acidobacteriota bacterium]
MVRAAAARRVTIHGIRPTERPDAALGAGGGGGGRCRDDAALCSLRTGRIARRARAVHGHAEPRRRAAARRLRFRPSAPRGQHKPHGAAPIRGGGSRGRGSGGTDRGPYAARAGRHGRQRHVPLRLSAAGRLADLRPGEGRRRGGDRSVRRGHCRFGSLTGCRGESRTGSTMRRILIPAAIILLLTPAPQQAQGPAVEPVEPFKVGTFDIHGVPHVGLVLRDSLVIDIEIATYALEVLPEYPHVPMPEDMLELIGRWDYGLKYRLFEMVNHVVNNDLLTGDGRADYVYDVSELRTRPPIMYPGKILNAAVNFYSHVNEGATPEERAAEMRRRREERGVPYLFQKPSRGAVIGNGDSIVIPYGRDRTDWEVELGAVIGRAAKYVSADDAQDYVFGYLVSIDVSDRGGRPPGGAPFTSDGLVG